MRRVGLRSHRVVFTALAAARRWRRARGGIGRLRAVWLPLVLRWRRPRRAAAPAARARHPGRAAEAAARHRERRAMPGGAIERVVRERLVFATFARDTRTRYRERDRFILATTSPERHAFMGFAAHRDGADARTWHRRSGTPDPRVEARAGRPSRDVVAGIRARHADAALPPTAFAVARELTPMRRAPVMRVARAAASQNAAGTGRRRVHADPVGRAPAAAIAALQRTATLVWRHREDRHEGASMMADARMATVRESIVPRAPAPNGEASRQPAPAAAPSPPAATPGLDAAFVDRLAEDVIRRVEKRARIERERRGS